MKCRFDTVEIYLFEVSDANIGTMCKICSKLEMKTPERRHCRRSDVLLLTLNSFHKFFWASVFDFEQVNVG